MAITVYTKPRCVQCDASKRALAKHGLDYSEVDLTQDPASLELVKQLGFSQAPVIVTESDAWAGFRPDKIKGLASLMAASQAPVAIAQ